MEENEKRGVVDVIQSLEAGGFLGKLDEALADLIVAVRQTRKKGKLVITIEAEPFEVVQVFVAADFSVKKPRPPKPRRLFFVDQNGALTDEPACQMRLSYMDEAESTDEPLRAEIEGRAQNR